MSGGSLDYAYTKMDGSSIEGVVPIKWSLERARDEAKDEGIPKAVERYERALALIDTLEKECKLLAPLTKAIEWYISGDWGVDAAMAEAKKLPDEKQKNYEQGINDGIQQICTAFDSTWPDATVEQFKGWTPAHVWHYLRGKLFGLRNARRP